MPVVAFCPCPPVLVPEVAQGAATELDDVRRACVAAVHELIGEAGRLGAEVVVVSGAHISAIHHARTPWSLHGFGVEVGDGRAPMAGPRLGLGSAIAAWLLDGAGWSGGRTYVELGPADADPPDEGILERLSVADALLVMGDGAAAHSERAPLSLDPAAGLFDDAVAEAVSAGDAVALAALPRADGRRLAAAGIDPWRAVGRARRGLPVATPRMLCRTAPYGVGYLVAVWS